MYKYEGPTALFKGLGPTLVGVVPGRSVPPRVCPFSSRSELSSLCSNSRSINFFVYGNGKQIYADYFNDSRENSAVHLSAAATAGVITAAATNPIWVVKTVMQLQQQQRAPPPTTPSSGASSSTAAAAAGAASRRPPLPPLPPGSSAASPSFSHSFRSITSPPLALHRRPTSYSTTVAIFRAEGIRGFYKGLSASLLGVTEGTIQWTLYEKFKEIANSGKRVEEQGGWRVSAAAGGAKLVATMITYPHEVRHDAVPPFTYLLADCCSFCPFCFDQQSAHSRSSPGHSHSTPPTFTTRANTALPLARAILPPRPARRRLASTVRWSATASAEGPA